jgi:hypothetical protein
MGRLVGRVKGKGLLTASFLCVGTVVTAAAFAVVIRFPALGAVPTPSLTTVYDQGLADRYVHSGDVLAAARPALTAAVSGEPKEIRDCTEFLSAARFPEMRTAWEGQQALDAYAECVPVAVLATAERPQYFLAPQAELGELLARRLDLASLEDGMASPALVHALRAAAQAAGGGVTLPAGSLRVEPQAVSFDGPTESWRLEVVASLDVQSHGLEQLLVRVAAPQSGLVGYAVLDQGTDGHLRAIPLEVLLLQDAQTPWWAHIDTAS